MKKFKFSKIDICFLIVAFFSLLFFILSIAFRYKYYALSEIEMANQIEIYGFYKQDIITNVEVFSLMRFCLDMFGVFLILGLLSGLSVIGYIILFHFIMYE